MKMKFLKVILAVIALISFILNSVLSIETNIDDRVTNFFVDEVDKSCYNQPCCPSIVRGHHKATQEFPGGELGTCLCHCHENKPLPYVHDRDGVNKDHVFCPFRQGYTKTPHTMVPKRNHKTFGVGIGAVMHGGVGGGGGGGYGSKNGSPCLIYATLSSTFVFFCATIAVTLIMLF